MGHIKCRVVYNKTWTKKTMLCKWKQEFGLLGHRHTTPKEWILEILNFLSSGACLLPWKTILSKPVFLLCLPLSNLLLNSLCQTQEPGISCKHVPHAKISHFQWMSVRLHFWTSKFPLLHAETETIRVWALYKPQHSYRIISTFKVGKETMVNFQLK